ncbi:MAG: hypothetical protein SVU94_11750 [Bacteroidota bacterium]|nr:hypothetical protein [Bacteroidota bacterium]
MKNCVKKEELFDYHNHSLENDRMSEIMHHLVDCKDCQKKLQTLENNISLVKKSLRSLNPDIECIPPLKFINNKKTDKKKFKLSTILSWAAGVCLIFAFSTLIIKKYTHNQKPVNDYEHYEYIPDLNDAWKQNSVSVTIYDKNGLPVNHQIIGD